MNALNYIFTTGNIHLFIWALAIVTLVTITIVIYLNKSLQKRQIQLQQRINERNILTTELKEIHNLYQHGPVVVMKWNDTGRDMFEFISDNIDKYGYNADDIVRIKKGDYVVVVSGDESADKGIITCESVNLSYRLISMVEN